MRHLVAIFKVPDCGLLRCLKLITRYVIGLVSGYVLFHFEICLVLFSLHQSGLLLDFINRWPPCLQARAVHYPHIDVYDIHTERFNVDVLLVNVQIMALRQNCLNV